MSGKASHPPNYLIHETSPYLLQHAHNPVQWYPWADEALGRARRENKPIFLSIGYAACHWCHVMERESFENEEIARILNEHFISIKVDREERPDLDDLYMQAVQLLSGSGGWPMSVFLTPEGKPFFGGTYFPPEDGYGRIGFRNLLLRINDVYRREQDKVLQNGDALTAAILENATITQQAAGKFTREMVDHAVAGLRARFDQVNGGFGGAPKFPPSMALNLLLREYSRTHDLTLFPLLNLTLQKMARGGMYDQLGGGFHRYSTDAHWLVPHFEKMLYDNALLAPVYFDAALVLQEPEFERIGREVLDWVLTDMQDEAGGFHSTLDADSEGVEGKFYTWRPIEVLETLTAAGFSKGDAERFLKFYDVSPQGNWHEAWEGSSIPNMRVPQAEFASMHNLGLEQTREAFDLMRETLLQVRRKRVPPGKDDKVLASWNGLMITAFARGAQVTGEARYRAAAQRAAEFILKQMRNEKGNLLHSWRHGVVKISGLLEDYACVIRALIDLYETDFNANWLSEADALAHHLLEQFYDTEHGGFFTTDGQDASVLIRMKDYYDGATPAGNSVAAQALVRLGLLLDNDDYSTAARRTMESIADFLARQAPAHYNMLCVVDDELNGWREVAVIGDPRERLTNEVLTALWRNYLPAKAVACAAEENEKAGAPIAISCRKNAVLAGKKAEGPGPTIYVCRNYTCAAPVKDVKSMLNLLSPR